MFASTIAAALQTRTTSTSCLKQWRTCLLMRAMRQQKRLLLVCMRLQSRRVVRRLQRQAALLWPEGEMRRHRQPVQSERVILMGSGACTVSAACLVYTGATHACRCAFILPYIAIEQLRGNCAVGVVLSCCLCFHVASLIVSQIYSECIYFCFQMICVPRLSHLS
jgi:hypothetical protein